MPRRARSSDRAIAAPDDDRSGLSLVAARSSVDLPHLPGEPVPLDLGVHVVVDTQDLEVHAKRRAYRLPVEVSPMGYTDGSWGRIPLPSTVVRDFRGLFATYRLLDARKRFVLRSGKEAFCLPNTDAVDLTLPGAAWRPFGTDLHTACGGPNALAVRQVLHVGSGDAYAQFLPGQSFDVTDLPDGTYWIEVVANPDGRLHEASTRDNRSVRRVVLGGTPGERTVVVPPHLGLDAPRTDGRTPFPGP